MKVDTYNIFFIIFPYMEVDTIYESWYLYQETSASSASTPISNSHLKSKIFFQNSNLNSNSNSNQSQTHTSNEKIFCKIQIQIQGQLTCHVPPHSDLSAWRWTCAGILKHFHHSIVETCGAFEVSNFSPILLENNILCNHRNVEEKHYSS